MRPSWWSATFPPNIDLDLPGIYEWEVPGIGLYIGKSKRLRRRIREYPNNVRKLLAGAPYRRNNHSAFRVVHHEMLRAYHHNLNVTVTILENCEQPELSTRERYWIDLRRIEAQTGGLPVLNAN